jgi:hypothetical protein
MDEKSLKKHAYLLHEQLKSRLGGAFKHNHALNLIAALAGLRDWAEVVKRAPNLDVPLDLAATKRLCKRLEEHYDVRLDPEHLLQQFTDPPNIVTRPTRYTLAAPKEWICDVCGEKIETAERGYVIWKSEIGKPFHSWKIVHRGECDLDDHDCSNALVDFLGVEGLNVALSYLDVGPLATGGRGPRSSIPNLKEFVDFIRRVQIPYYDLARARFDNPRVIEDFTDHEVQAFTPESCRRIATDPDYKD